MQVHIGHMHSEVRPVDDRNLLSPKVLSRIVDEVVRTLDQRRASDARRAEDSQLWSSVRSGTGR